jgi:hypothetical protein
MQLWRMVALENGISFWKKLTKAEGKDEEDGF